MSRVLPWLSLVALIAACDEVTPEQFTAEVDALSKQQAAIEEEVDPPSGPPAVYTGPGDTVPGVGAGNCYLMTGAASCRVLPPGALCAWNSDWAAYDNNTPASVIASNLADAMSSYALNTFGLNSYPTSTCQLRYASGETMATTSNGAFTCGPQNLALSDQCVPGGEDDLIMDVESLYTFQSL